MLRLRRFSYIYIYIYIILKAADRKLRKNANRSTKLERINARYEYMEKFYFLNGTFLGLLMMTIMNIHFVKIFHLLFI